MIRRRSCASDRDHRLAWHGVVREPPASAPTRGVGQKPLPSLPVVPRVVLRGFRSAVVLAALSLVLLVPARSDALVRTAGVQLPPLARFGPGVHLGSGLVDV